MEFFLSNIISLKSEKDVVFALIIVVQCCNNLEIANTAAATTAVSHGIEEAVELKPVEHLIEPLDNGTPIQSLLPDFQHQLKCENVRAILFYSWSF